MSKKSDESDFLIPWVGGSVPWSVSNNQKYHRTKNGVTRLIAWKANEPFRASFKLEKFPGMESRVRMINTANDKHCWIRIKELQEAFLRTAVVYGVFIGEWEFKKTLGRYYGLRLLG